MVTEIPEYIQDRLDLPPQAAGGRHHDMTELSYMMVGEGFDDSFIFSTLRRRYPDKDKSDKEIRDLVEGARKRGPKPAEKRTRRQLSPIEYRFKADTRKPFNYTPPDETLEVPKSKLSTADFLKLAFQPGETVCVNTTATLRDGKWSPASSGTFAKLEWWLEFLNNPLKSDFFKRPQGAWIRLNPFAGDAAKGEDHEVSNFRHLLIESDHLPKEQQWDIYRKSELPITSITDSGGSSLHAWVRVDAKDLEEFKARAAMVYETLVPLGFDAGNKNPSRMSRLPGAERDGNIQQLVATNIGAASFDEWEKTQVDDGLGDIDDADRFEDPEPDDEVIELLKGVLAIGCKLLLGGPSKAKKSWALIALALAVGHGMKWWNFETTQAHVLYINFELKKRTMKKRLKWVREAMGIKKNTGVDFWNLRGKAASIDQLVERFLARLKGKDYGLIIIDPVYKCLGDRDENAAGDITDFLNHVERLSEDTGAAVVMAAHFAKGDHSEKATNDRVSGSGVWIRDPDAVIMLSPRDPRENNPTKFEVGVTVREFDDVPQFNVEWRKPLMCVDDTADELPKEDWYKEQMIKLVELLPAGGMVSNEWENEALERLGYKKSHYKACVKLANDAAVVTKEHKNAPYIRDDAEFSKLKGESTTNYTWKRKDLE